MDCKNIVIRIERTETKGLWNFMVHIPLVMKEGEWAYTPITVFQMQQTGMLMCAEAEMYWMGLENELNSKMTRMSPILEKQINEILEGK